MASLKRKQPVCSELLRCCERIVTYFMFIDVLIMLLKLNFTITEKLPQYASVNSPEKMLSSRDGGISQIRDNIRIHLMISEEDKKHISTHTNSENI